MGAENADSLSLSLALQDYIATFNAKSRPARANGTKTKPNEPAKNVQPGTDAICEPFQHYFDAAARKRLVPERVFAVTDLADVCTAPGTGAMESAH